MKVHSTFLSVSEKQDPDLERYLSERLEMIPAVIDRDISQLPDEIDFETLKKVLGTHWQSSYRVRKHLRP